MYQKNLNKKLNLLLKSLNIKKNDKVIIHSNISGLFQFHKTEREKIYNFFLKFLKNYIGCNGIIIIPTYNYDFTNNKNFNLKKTSSKVGLFSNYLLKKFWRKRTLDPIFSHIIFGRIKNFNLKEINTEAFGEKSIFSILKRQNFKIICFCCSIDRITFLHYLEYKFNVPYRYKKKFKGKMIYENKKKEIIYKYNVGKKSLNYSLKQNNIKKLINNEKFIKSNLGKFDCYSVSAKYLYSILKKKLKKNKKFLIE